MSIVFEKSKSEKYKKYFTPEKALENQMTLFSIKQQAPLDAQNVIYNNWDVGKAGVPLFWDKEKQNVAVDHTDTHTLVIGPTGSKKSRLVVMPLVRILGSTGESMIISDPKAEIYNRTASFLQQHNYQVYVLNLRAPMHGHGWNPLSIPYSFYTQGEIDKAYEFVNDIAQNIIAPKKDVNDPFWTDSAASFFSGLVLLLFKYSKEHALDASYVHIGNVIQLRNTLFTGSTNTPNTELWNYAKEDYIISSALIGTVQTASETRGGILSTFDQNTRLFSVQPNILDTLANNNIDYDSFEQKPTAVYLIVPDEKTSYHGLVSLFIKQSYEYLIYKAQNIEERDGFHVGTLKNRLNYILDEFSSLPTIKDFPAMITAARSRNIRFTLIIQSKHQLLQRYKDETNTIQTNCNNWIFLTSRELTFLEEVSSLCGKTAEESPRPILSVTDLQRLDKESGEVLILTGRSKPVISHLADISVYDQNQYTSSPIEKRTPHTPPLIQHFVKPNNDHTGQPNQQKASSAINLSVNELVKRIDEKLAEIEREEKEAKEKKNKSSQNKKGSKASSSKKGLLEMNIEEDINKPDNDEKNE